MKKKNIYNLIILLLFLCSFNSCKEPSFDFTDDPESLLCGNKWIDTYTDEYGDYTEQILEFYQYGKGTETIIHYYSPNPGDFDAEKYGFTWEWDEDNSNAIFMDYDDGGYTYFSDLYITPYELSGLLGDLDVTFEPL